MLPLNLIRDARREDMKWRSRLKRRQLPAADKLFECFENILLTED
jgi:hypothetical protein